MNTTTMRRTWARITAGGIGIGIVAAGAIAMGAAGAAHAGTIPITHSGEPSVAMTITNHTGRGETLIGNSSSSGGWVNEPQQYLAPGQSETLVAVAGNSDWLAANAEYQIADGGPVATYTATITPQGGVDTTGSATTGPEADCYGIHTTIDSGYPTVNIGYLTNAMN